MGNTVTSRIGIDLGYKKPSSISESIYNDQLKYGALSEWLRTSTLDVDPLMGSSKVGVSRDYLEERGADTLMDLSQSIDGITITKARAKKLVSWMIDQMLFIGEFSNPLDNNILSVTNQTVSYDLNHARITGIRKSGEPLLQRGLCHWDKNTTSAKDAAAFEDARATREQNLITVDQSLANKFGRTNATCRSDIFALGIGRFANGKFLIKRPLGGMPDYLKIFVLTRAFPYDKTPLNWDVCQTWHLANF